MSIFQNVATEATKASPHVTVSGLILWGYTLSDAVLALSFVFAILQIFFGVRKYIRDEKYHKARMREAADGE